MTRNRARRARRSFMALALAGIGQFGCGPAMAEPPGLALVIGVDRDASQAGGGVCGPAARGLRDRLSAQGLAVQAVLNPSAVAMRSAIDDFAAQVEKDRPGTALIYACGMAVSAADHLFLMPSDAGSDGRVDPARQGVVVQALLNALAGTGGTLYADLGLAAPAAGETASEAGKRLPAGLHLALNLTERDGAARFGERLLAGFQAGQGWDATAAMLQAGPAFPDGTVQTLLSPASAAASAAPASAEAAPPDADSDAAPRPDPAGPQPETPPQPPAPARGAEAPRAAGRSEPPGVSRIKRLQAALARSGYAGPMDGRLNGPTVAAIRTFQRSLGDPETGVLTQTELVYLLNR